LHKTPPFTTHHSAEWFTSTAQGFAVGTTVVLLYSIVLGVCSPAFVTELLTSQLWSIAIYMGIAGVAGALAYM
jgi:hypothetical protein